MTKKILFFVQLASLTLSPGLRAQYQWHTVQPDYDGFAYYGFQAISCFGENVSALAWTWSQGESNSNIIFYSSDGGNTLNSISDIPQYYKTWNSQGSLGMSDIEQIDSVNAIAVGGLGITLRTSDNWRTWKTDTVVLPPVILYGDTLLIDFSGVDFFNSTEGNLFDANDNLTFSTLDSGMHVVRRAISGGRAYGNDIFREFREGDNFNDPDTILTTYNDWSSTDTAIFRLNGPFLNATLIANNLYFGLGDTLLYLAFRYDSTRTHQITTLVRSTDLGANWSELPVPQSNKITARCVSLIDEQTIVVAGTDSSGEILLSRDHGSTWELDTVPLENGEPYLWISAVAVTGSGRVIAAITTDSNVDGSNLLAYLEPAPAIVTQPVSAQIINIYPNPAASALTIEAPGKTISISDPLGRSYAVPRNGNTLDVSSLPAGIYFIQSGSSSAKFVKE